MSDRYSVMLEERAHGKRKKRAYDLKADPKLKNVFVIELDPWRSVRVEIKPKRWWFQ